MRRVNPVTVGYVDLLAEAIEVARAILCRTPENSNLQDRGRFIYDWSKRLASVDLTGNARGTDRAGVGYEALELLSANWKDIVTGTTSGEKLLRLAPKFWPRLMMEWPMGAYAELAVDFIRKGTPLRGKRILEVGAGVGAVASQMPELLAEDYIRSDLNPLIASRNLPGRVAYHDFNNRGRWDGLDLIFGVNALHCARDPASSILYLSEMLRSGGLLLLAEGQATTTPDGTPWGLNHFFGLFDGWWNIGGFREPQDWLHALKAAGLRDVDHCPYGMEGHALGGLFWGRVP